MLDRVYLAWEDILQNKIDCLPAATRTRAIPACKLARVGAITKCMISCGLKFDHKIKCDEVPVDLSAMQSITSEEFASAYTAVQIVAAPHRQCVQQIQQSILASFNEAHSKGSDRLGERLSAHFADGDQSKRDARSDRVENSRKRIIDGYERQSAEHDQKRIKLESRSAS